MSSKGNSVVNVYGTDHVRLKQLAQEERIPMREMFEKVLDVYIKSKGPAARKVTLMLDVDMYKGAVQVVTNVRPYKPWLAREDTDDLREMSAEEAEALSREVVRPGLGDVETDADVAAIEEHMAAQHPLEAEAKVDVAAIEAEAEITAEQQHRDIEVP